MPLKWIRTDFSRSCVLAISKGTVYLRSFNSIRIYLIVSRSSDTLPYSTISRNISARILISSSSFLLSYFLSFFLFLYVVFLANLWSRSATHASDGRCRLTRALVKILQLAPRRARRSSRSFDEYSGKATTSHWHRGGKKGKGEEKESTRKIVFPPLSGNSACDSVARDAAMKPARIAR